MSIRAQLIRQVAGLAEEDVRALLALVERLRARSVPSSPGHVTSLSVVPSRHPERFGMLLGSVQVMSDVEAPVADPDDWTFDAVNLET